MHETLEPLRAAVAEGLGPHHNVTGTCAVYLTDEEVEGELRLTPGEVTVGEVSDAPTAALHVDAATLQQLVEGDTVDFRSEAFREQCSLEGDLEFAVRSVVLALRRPSATVRFLFRNAEAQSRANPKVAALSQVERLEQLPMERFREKLSEGVPFVVEGALGNWAATRDFNRWARANAEVALGVVKDPNATLGRFLQEAKETRDVHAYTHGVPLPQPLVPGFPPPVYGALGRLSPPQLWMGVGKDPGTPVTPLHRDAQLGMLGQLHGRKRFTVFPPHQAESLYTRPGYDSYQNCWVEPHRPDLERYPLYKDATPIDFVIGPGDLLVQPLGWFHCVYSLDDVTASVSYFVG